MNILGLILSVVSFVLFCLAASKVNLSCVTRGRQFLVPIISVIYCVVAIIFLDSVSIWIKNLVVFATQYIPFLSALNTDVVILYVVNVAFVLGHTILKGILLPILSKIWSSNSVMTVTSGIFYDYKSDVDKWFIKREYANFRGFCRAIYYGLLIATSILFILSINNPQWIVFKATLYPFVGILVLGEISNLLSGMTEGEFVEDILGEDEESYNVANYGMLRKILRDLYGERVLYENTVSSNNGISETFDTLTEMSESEDKLNRIMGEYFLKLKESGEDIDINYVKSSINLLKGNSTLFNNPFYKDLTNYLVVPMTKQLTNYKKCLIIVGRDSAAADVESWMEESVASFTGTKSLWKTKVLSEVYSDTDIGIIKFSDIYNLKMHRANKDFLRQVGFVLLIEPSRILASGQIGINLLVNACESDDKKIVYCACDRNCDGLVDALSHTLKTSITQVTATLQDCMSSSHMYWDAEGRYMHHKILPNISRYLGMGTEINSVAIKYQLKNTGWIGSEKFPVVDMKWIAGQYYREICDYADMPQSQDAFNRIFNVDPNLWSVPKCENAFLVVEDEFQNLFEATRTFASRAKNQSFINVISENYFLRDYMLDNVDVFVADPKAIPTIVPDYARTERNTVLKLIMMMVHEPVGEERIEKEFMLSGITFADAYETLKELIIKHCNVEDPTLSVLFKEKLLDDSLNTKTVKHYEINETNELFNYAQTLKNAYYLAEDEEGDKHYIGAKLYGHVFQALLPGQFMTFDGKYYEIETITPLNGVVTRRAADHINDRKYYRQIRKIKIDKFTEGCEMGSKKSIAGIEIINGFADIEVETEGYLQMSSYGNFKKAKKVLINNIPNRNYRNKSVLKIKLPGMNDQVRYTVCLLLNEIFRTTYPNAYHYISAVAPNIYDGDDNMKYALYDLVGECEPECFYIVEDSDVDLGLTVSVERNLKRYLEIISDVLQWHIGKMSEVPEVESEEEYVPVFDNPVEQEETRGIIQWIIGLFKKKDEEKSTEPEAEIAVAEGKTPVAETKTEEKPDEKTAEEFTAEESAEAAESEAEEKKEKKSLGTKVKDFFKKLFGRKEKEGTTEDTPAEETPAEETPVEEETVEEEASEEMPGEEKAVALHDEVPGTLTDKVDEEENSGNGEDSETVQDIDGEDEETISPDDVDMTKYQKHCFLKFGYDKISESLAISETVEFLAGYGFDKNPLQQVRLGERADEDYDPHKYGAHLCDFCGVELLGGEYEVLKDGRERCNRCSVTAVKTAEGFKQVFKDVMRNMETFYNIKINTAIKVRMTDAQKIAKHVGMVFVPTPGFDGRVLGFAQKDKTGYSIYVENGSPKLAAIATIAHELTHIWQYLNWNDAEIQKKYGKANSLEIYEGMAKWVEIQYLILLGERAYAQRQEISTRMRDDAYGKGFIKFCEKYPLSYDTNLTKTPFKLNPPL